MKTKSLMPTTLLLLAIILMVALHYAFPLAAVIPPYWNLLGTAPLLLGIAINLAADKAFHRAGTTVKPFLESEALLTDGVFRLTRNPMYLGFVFILSGTAVLMRTLTPFSIILLFAVLIDRMYIREEERMMAVKFQERWTDYKKNTRRWL